MKRLVVEVEYPDSVDLAEAREYIQAALLHWGGQRHPDDHLFYGMRAIKARMRLIRPPLLRRARVYVARDEL